MSELLLLHKRIDIDASPVLYDKPFTPESLTADWEIRGGEWFCEDGALSAASGTVCLSFFAGGLSRQCAAGFPCRNRSAVHR